MNTTFNFLGAFMEDGTSVFCDTYVKFGTPVSIKGLNFSVVKTVAGVVTPLNIYASVVVYDRIGGDQQNVLAIPQSINDTLSNFNFSTGNLFYYYKADSDFTVPVDIFVNTKFLVRIVIGTEEVLPVGTQVNFAGILTLDIAKDFESGFNSVVYGGK